MSPKKRRRAIALILLTVVALFVLLMALTGRLHWIAALFAGLLPFARQLLPLLIRMLPFINHWYKRRQGSQQASGNRSEVTTRILSMTLDHDSGVMYGSVNEGPLQGRVLGELSEQEFLQLLNYCRQQDADSTRLLETYLDKRFGDSWRADDQQQTHHNAESSGDMSKAEAYEILGLQPGCSREEIITAHRRLMQKYHPDRGGSDYLAAKINQAKDLLTDD
ncbi:DnaJ domain-containing protein [Neptuniibacter halophilus]|uniref:DnaJ domain-containing protein n=1 Tax=Neptuniibacter halophilus TaxID=651666 RepID=UPI002573083B|nr:DnaJ domain-containing protein [Neptuniibacter halophilus]